MKPILYEAGETSFASNGLGRLNDFTECLATEERNGIFELDFDYPTDGAHFADIIPGRIIYATHDDTGIPQPYDIVSYSRPIDGVVTFHAEHISYRQRGLTVAGTNINSLEDAFTLLGTAQPSNPFTYEADFTSTAYLAAADGVPRSVRQILGGIEGSILDAYGGEYEWDGFRVILHAQRGQLRDFTIRYGVNMLEYEENADYSSTYSSCIPYWKGNQDGQDIIVTGNKVESGSSTYSGRDVCVPLDLTEKFEDAPTTAQLESMAATYMQSNQVTLPAQNIKVNFVRLQDLGYDWLDDLLQCRLCDTVSVVFPRYNMSGTFKIVKTVWNVLEDRYEEMELGALSTTLAEALGISNAADSFNKIVDLGIAGDLAVGGDATVAGSVTAGGVDLSTVQTFNLTSQYVDIIGARKCGHVVVLRFVNFKTIPAGSFDALTLPADLHPAVAVSFDALQPKQSGSTTTGYHIRVTVNTNGVVSCYNYSASAISGNTNATGTITYIV